MAGPGRASGLKPAAAGHGAGSLPHAGRSPGCPICRAGDTEEYAAAVDRFFAIAPGRFRLVRCRACGCIFQHPLPSAAELARYYADDYWWSPPAPRRAGLRSLVGRLEHAYRTLVARDHVSFVERCARRSAAGRALLDIGCGEGLFLHLARRRGFEAHGMDPSARAVELARARYGLDVRRGAIGSDLWEGRRFDFVTMFHVLEHVADPRAALAYAGRHLREGGSLIVQVPNVRSFQARHFGARWYGLDVPRHVINYSPEGLRIVLRDAGFEVAAAKRFSLRDNPASLASSLAPRLDPQGRKVRGHGAGSMAEGVLELVYFALYLLCLPPALLESACGCGATVFVQARVGRARRAGPVT